MTFRHPPRRERQTAVTPRPRQAVKGSGLLAAAMALPELAPIQPAATDAAGRRHMGRVAALGCILCRRLGHGIVACEVHHLREGQGGAQRASDFLTVGLCAEHHRGATGLHGLGVRAFERRYGVGELGMLAEVIALLTDTA